VLFAARGPAVASDGVSIYGPMALALQEAYHQWTAFHGFVPPTSFEAIIDGTRDPYTVRFATTGDALATEVTYAVPAATVLDPRLPKLPAFLLPRHLGPIRIRGSYVVAFAAAYRFREHHPPESQLAPLDGDTSWASFETITWHRDNYFVTMRYFDPRLRGVIGCDVQQNYVVDWRRFVVTPMKECWPA
jgi:hypothetical protein